MTARPTEICIVIRPTADQAPGIVGEVLKHLRSNGWDASPGDKATADLLAAEEKAAWADLPDGRKRHVIERGSMRAIMAQCLRRDIRNARHLGPEGIWVAYWTDDEVSRAHAAATAQGLL